MDQATRKKVVAFIWGRDVTLVIEKAAKGLLDSLLVGGTPA